MQLRTLPPVTALVSTHRTTLQQLEQLLPVSKELYADAAAHTLISGPLFWIYHGMDGKPDTEFTLEIAVPIQGKFQSSKFSIKDLAPFRAVTHRHEGPWNQLPDSYGQIFQYVEAHKVAINDELREIYLNVDFSNPANNITEIQMGAL
jgi:effector-binding domain-containing protein